MPSQQLLHGHEAAFRGERGVRTKGRAQEERGPPRVNVTRSCPTQQFGIGRPALLRVADRRPPDRLVWKGLNLWQPPGCIDEDVPTVVRNDKVCDSTAELKLGGELRAELAVGHRDQLWHDHRRG